MSNENQAGAAETETREQQGQTEGAGTEREQQATFTQSDLDRAIAKAIATREKKIRDEQEEKDLLRKRDYDELVARMQRKERELLEGQARSEYVAKHNLGGFADLFRHVPADGLDAAREQIEAAVKAEVERRVGEALKTPRVPQGADSGQPKRPSEMSTEEYLAWKKQRGLY